MFALSLLLCHAVFFLGTSASTNDRRRNVVGTREPTGTDFLRWLQTLSHCTSGKACALTVDETCAWTQTEWDPSEVVTKTSLVVQNHRGDNKFATFVLDSRGNFVNIAQENTTATIPLMSPYTNGPTFSDGKVIFSSSYNVFGGLPGTPGGIECVPFENLLSVI
eukprot:Awhi_evm1s260